MNLNIRLAKPSDLVNIVPLIEEHALYERAEFSNDGVALRLGDAIKANAPRLYILVAEIRREIVAYCALSREFSTWKAGEYLHMDCLYTHRGRRGMSIGSAMFKEAVSLAQELDIFELQWQTPSWNEGAIRFYQRLGASHTAKRRFSYSVA